MTAFDECIVLHETLYYRNCALLQNRRSNHQIITVSCLIPVLMAHVPAPKAFIELTVCQCKKSKCGQEHVSVLKQVCHVLLHVNMKQTLHFAKDSKS